MPSRYKITDKLNKREKKFYQEATKRGYKILRIGWPDFLIIKERDTYGVEVKARGQHRSPKQLTMQNTLELVGILCPTS